MKHYMAIAGDMKNPISLFYSTYPPSPDLQIRESYKDLACSSCGRINELSALERGIERDIQLPDRMADVVNSDDDFKIVSLGCRSFLETCDNARIRYFSFPSDSRFFVAVPEILIPIEKDNKAFRTEGFCAKCGRFRNVLIGTELFPLPSDLLVGAFMFENAKSLSPVWLISEVIVQKLKTSKLKGFEFHPYFKVGS